jgi:hypothetical protein
MIEVVRVIVTHVDLIHDSTGGNIFRHGIGNDLLQPQDVESELQHGTRRFRGVSPIPVFRSQTPADLYTRSEVCLETRNRKSDKSGEWDNSMDDNRCADM